MMKYVKKPHDNLTGTESDRLEYKEKYVNHALTPGLIPNFLSRVPQTCLSFTWPTALH